MKRPSSQVVNALKKRPARLTDRVPTLVFLVAMREECAGILTSLGLKEVWRSDGGQQAVLEGFACGFFVKLGITGILEHNAVGLLARLLHGGCPGSRDVALTSVHACVNFGSVGAYEESRLRIGDAVFVHEVRHYDIDVPTSDPWHSRNLKLQVPSDAMPNDVVCTSGGRFTQSQPGCDCEDMELYGIASMCNALGLPIYSLKYVANYCNDSGLEDFENNVEHVRAQAEKNLMNFLSHLSSSLSS